MDELRSFEVLRIIYCPQDEVTRKNAITVMKKISEEPSFSKEDNHRIVTLKPMDEWQGRRKTFNGNIDIYGATLESENYVVPFEVSVFPTRCPLRLYGGEDEFDDLSNYIHSAEAFVQSLPGKSNPQDILELRNMFIYADNSSDNVRPILVGYGKDPEIANLKACHEFGKVESDRQPIYFEGFYNEDFKDAFTSAIIDIADLPVREKFEEADSAYCKI